MTNLNAVLLAEDDDDDSMFFEQAVRAIDPTLQVIKYSDGMALLDQIHQVENPGILFLDVNMPKLNGYQCLLKLRADPAYRELPVIIFSTSGSPDLILKLKQAGADAFMVKPNDFNGWRDLIENALKTDWRNAAAAQSAERKKIIGE